MVAGLDFMLNAVRKLLTGSRQGVVQFEFLVLRFFTPPLWFSLGVRVGIMATKAKWISFTLPVASSSSPEPVAQGV